MSQKPRARRRLADLSARDPDRLAGLSDGIFAVGMTLLVLGLAVPVVNGSNTTEGELWQALRSLGPSVLVYTMSFMTLGIFVEISLLPCTAVCRSKDPRRRG